MPQKIASAQLVMSSDQADLIRYPVYSPWVVDSQGEAILDKTLVGVAHEWMIRGRMANVDIEHDGIGVNARVCESWITDKGDSRFPIPGTWAQGMRLFDPELIEMKNSGEINGVSLLTEYPPFRTKLPTLVSSPLVAAGVTQNSVNPNVPLHSHPITINFDGNAKEIPGVTGKSLDHDHPYIYGDATEVELGHSHPVMLARLNIQYAQKVVAIGWLTNVSVLAISLVKHGANWQPIISPKSKRALEVVKLWAPVK